MKRDERLIPLSHDHHHGLVLALRIKKGAEREQIDAAFVSETRKLFDDEVEPHFLQEEEWLLPALNDAGETELVKRTLGEHRELRELLAAAADNDGDESEKSLVAFGELLNEHIRFEERELFEIAQTVLSDEVLDELAPHFHAQK